jgi:hypothetical protein
MTQYQFALENELIEGRNPYRFITDFKDIKFSSKHFREEFLKNEQLRFALYDKTVPILRKQLSRVDPDQVQMSEDELTVAAISRLEASQVNETFEEVS